MNGLILSKDSVLNGSMKFAIDKNIFKQFKWVLGLGFLSLSLGAQSAQSVNLSLRDFSCQDVSDCCYRQIFSQFSAERVTWPSNQAVAGRIYGSSTILRLFPERTREVYLLVHGLWATELQFDPLGQWISENKRANVIEYSLPGHGYGRENCAGVGCVFTYQDWLLATEDAIKMAKAFGDRIVFIGHSVGGTLGIEQAMKWDSAIAGLILIEPAIRVDPVLTLTSCAGKVFIENIMGIAPVAGYHPDRRLPTNLGSRFDDE